MKRNIIYSLLGVLTMALTLAACTDDWLNNEGGQMPEGETCITATVEFLPLRPALDVKTRTAGDAIKDINNLCVLLYDKDGNLVKSYYLLPEGSAEGEDRDSEFKVDDTVRTDADAEGEKTAESKTQQATFQLSEVPYGYYYIYAIANMGDLAKQESYKENIKTTDGLKSIDLTWATEWTSTEEGEAENKVTKATANNQMFGHFTVMESASTGTNRNTEDSQVAINKKGMKLHAWLRRAASKVTIAYDASQLEEGVFIYLKSVQIKDIPLHCYLGKDNNVGATEYTLQCPENGTDMPDGEIIKYYEGETEPTAFDESYPVRLSTGKSYYPWPVEENGTLQKKGHEETSDALFFFENMQGAGENMPDKRQDSTGPDGTPDGKLDHPGMPGDTSYRLKDDVPYGTYIEVDAYYRSINPKKVGSGNIKYRFMLGKNTIKDYNAERNHHYKLTLLFKNFANDADWHIEYQEPEPGIEVPNPYYISYLYNRTMDLPIKINPGYEKVTKVTAEIINNGWAPINVNETFDYYKFDLAGNNVWNGFLSLRRTTATILTKNKEDAIEGSGIAYAEDNKEYYYRTNRGNREYKVTPGLHEDAEDGNYSVRAEAESNTIHMSIPLYTRAKQMIATTSYTGNNPYVAYQRQAKVKITVTLSNGKTLEEIVDIFQVRRIVNPKGIYRRHDNDDPFHVVLKYLEQENATEFQEFTSEGPWEAVIAATTHPGFVKLKRSSNNQMYTQIENDTLKGFTGSIIDFMITFNGKCSNPNESRHAVIRVSYHNKTCNHLIFVRQGYAPIALLDGERAWHTFNMKTATTETDSPVEEGSLFKWGNYNAPIDAVSNKHEKEPWINISPSDFKDDKDTPLKIAGTENTQLWDEIESKPYDTPFGNPTINGKEVEIASYEDYNALYKSEDIEMGYGVLYGDEAGETLSNIDQTYGYRYNTSKEYGMRGCFIYNKHDGRNLFFPIGASGYGHRKQGYGDKKNWQGIITGQGDIHGETNKTVVLRYSAGRSDKFPMTSGDEKPLFYDLYMRPGAIYWLQKVYPPGRDGETDIMGWDINYFSFDFNLISKSNVYATITEEKEEEKTVTPKSNACFIRCVEPQK